MKIIRLTFFLLIIVLMSGCLNHNNPKEYISDKYSSMGSVTRLFNKYSEAVYSSGNSIQREELFKEREKELRNYIDSMVILTNLEGRIRDINLRKNSKSHILEYEIKVMPKEYLELTLYCRHLINKDSLDSDYMYNKIKSFNNGSVVYFDGIFSIEVDKNLPRGDKYPSIQTTFINPKYFFHVVEISALENDTLSQDLRNALHQGRDVVNYMFAEYRKEKTTESHLQQLLNIFNDSRKVLDQNEDEYVQRYIDQIMLDVY